MLDRFSAKREGDVVILRLPFPPSLNHYYQIGKRRNGKGMLMLSPEGRVYKQQVFCVCIQEKHLRFPRRRRLQVNIDLHPPAGYGSYAGWDLDNHLKALLDGLQEGKVLFNDKWIDKLVVRRRPATTDGLAVVFIQDLRPEEGELPWRNDLSKI